MMRLLRAWLTLVWLSFRRLLWSASTLMILFPLAGGALFLLRRRYDRMEDVEVAFTMFSNFVILVFASFLVPICALAYGTASVGGDREDRTLLFLLVRPIPRSLVLLAKFTATLPLTIGLTAAAFFLYCRLAGEPGEMAYQLYLPAVMFVTLAYIALFHLFAVALRHATIVALIYAIFMEVLLGNLPGIVKRVAVNFYGRSLMYSYGASEGLNRPDFFEPISANSATWVLVGIAFGAMLLAMLIFERREYRDLT